MKKWLLCLLTVLVLTGCGQTEVIEETESETETMVDKTQEVAAEIDADILQWEENSITIPGLQQDYEVWVMSDLHMTLVNEDESDEIIQYAKERAPVFTNEAGVSSDAILSAFVKEANEKQPDLILFGGDILDFPSEANLAFLQENLDALTVPYVFAMGNHDWTFPWEYMTPEGSEKYRPLFDGYLFNHFADVSSMTVLAAMGNSYAGLIELSDMVVLAIDNSSNQVAAEALELVGMAYEKEKPIVLLQHVPFSTENLIAEAAKSWGNPVTLGMQVHGGIAPNEASTDLWYKTHDEESPIKAVLAGHIHFPYQEGLSDTTVQLVSDAAFKGSVMQVNLTGVYQYFCDKFMLTVDNKQFDLKEIEPELSSVSELLPITNEQLYILGRIDETSNAMLIYDFTKKAFVFQEQGSTLCWIQDEYDSVRYLKENVVYDLDGNVIYEAKESELISMIEYVEKDFKVSVTDLEHENPQEIWID